jgi:hypothetical protein
VVVIVTEHVNELAEHIEDEHVGVVGGGGDERRQVAEVGGPRGSRRPRDRRSRQ